MRYKSEVESKQKRKDKMRGEIIGIFCLSKSEKQFQMSAKFSSFRAIPSFRLSISE
jgi:hypothetical protein